MENIAQTVICLAAGVALGLLFYGGLWITVRELQTSRHPVILTFGSLWLRIALVLAGLLFVLHGRWENALAYLIGLVASRFAISRFVRCL
jgi:F1F0 ATPase subunit 2